MQLSAATTTNVRRVRRQLAVLPMVLAAAIPGRCDEVPDKSADNFSNPTPVEHLREMTVDGPGHTESPFTVDAGHFQIEMTLFGRSSYKEQFDGVTYKYEWWGIGPINLKAGLYKNLDVQLILEPYSHAVETEAGFSRAKYDGFGDTTLRFKVNLWGNDSGRTAMALIPYVKFPTSAEGLGRENAEGGFVLPFSMALPGDFYLGLTSKFAKVLGENESSYQTEYENSIAISRALFGDLEGYVEFFSAVSTEEDSKWVGTFDTGLSYWLSDDLQLNAGVDIGVTTWADDWYAFVGMAWRY